MSAIGSSSLDVNALVQSLMAAESAPLALRFNRAEAGAKTKITAFAALSAAFDKLKTSLTALKASSSFEGRSTKSSDDAVFTASAGSTVAIGSYSVEVLELASAQKLTSAGLAAGTGLGAGQLSLTVGAVSFAVDITAGSDTPSAIQTAINSAATAAGAKLNVTLVNSDGGQSLVFNSTEIGAANAITITNTSAPANAALNAYINANLTQNTGALDAQVKVDGLLTSASSNTLSDIVPGLTLTLKAKDPGNVKTLTVSADNSAGKTLLQGFVTAYNGAISALASTTKYNAETKTASVLTGDSSARGAGHQLRTALGDALQAVSDAGYGNLGLTSSVTGTLSFDTAKFDAAMASDPSGVAAVLSGDNGLAAKLSVVTEGLVGTDGIFKSRTDALNQRLKSIGVDRAAAERRLTSIEARYRKQFSALDALLSKMQGTSNFLAQQLSSLSNTNR